MLQQLQQVGADKADGLLHISVGGLTVAADEGGAFHIFLAQVTVGIAYHSNGHVRAYDAAHFL